MSDAAAPPGGAPLDLVRALDALDSGGRQTSATAKRLPADTPAPAIQTRVGRAESNRPVQAP